MKPAAETKQCRHCLNVCELTRFAKRSQSKDGLEGHCRDCERIRKASQAAAKSEQIIGTAESAPAVTKLVEAATPVARVNALNDDQTLASAIAKVRPVKAAAAKRTPKAATK